MANAFYVSAAEALLAPLLGTGSDLTGTLKAVLMKDTYVPSMSSDEFYSDISTHAKGTPITLASLVVTGGKLDAADPTFTGLTAGDDVNAIVLYLSTGVDATSALIAYLDDATGLPFTTDGSDFEPIWDNGTYKIVSLV